MTVTKTTTKPRYSSQLAGKLLIITIVICTFAPLCYCAEQESKSISKSKLEFNFQKKPVNYHRKKNAPPAIVPTHCAQIYIIWYHHGPTLPEVDAILKTSAGKSISTLQRDFLKTGNAIVSHTSKASRPRNLRISYNKGKISYILYAVSKDDAIKMAEAFAEVFLKQNNAALKPFLDEYLSKFHDKLRQNQKRVTETKAQIPKKEQELKELKTEFGKLKERGYYQSDDQAEKAILELNATLRTEKIELAGMEAKRAAISNHMSRVSHRFEEQTKTDKKTLNWEPILLNLEQKYIDVMIDFQVAKARQQTARDLRGRAQSFLNQIDKIYEISRKVSYLKERLENYEHQIRQIETVLAKPGPDMFPLRIDENRAVIRPVEIKTNEGR